MSEQPWKCVRCGAVLQGDGRVFICAACQQRAPYLPTGAAPAEPLTDRQQRIRDAIAKSDRHYIERLRLCPDDCIVCQAEKRTREEVRTQLATQQAALREALDLLDRIAGWPADDWQGLKYHAFEVARRLRHEA